MNGVDPPPWCEWRHGRSPVLILAPHGGRYDQAHPATARRPRKVNDLFTAAVAAELADALDGSLLVNTACDRNLLDLNRISQVAARAPWFLSLLARLLADILARHERAEVWFVHGWNVIQARCDVGVGHALAQPTDAVDAAAALTVGPEYAMGRLGALQRACAARDIAVSFGERYPGRHPNNLLQLFRRTHDRPPHPPLAAWAAARRIEAVQLELGIALRWPGAPRRALIDAVRHAFAAEARPAARRRRAAPPGEDPGRAASLQLYDAAAEIGVAVRVEPDGPAGPVGRVLLFLGRTRVALFIGESLCGGPPREGPTFTAQADGFDVRFDGFALATDEGWRYVELEDAFASSQLCTVRLALRFRRRLSAEYGVAAGEVELDGIRSSIAAPAFARHGILQRTGTGWSSHVAMVAALSPVRALRVRHEFPGRSTLHELTPDGEQVRALTPLTVHFDGDRHAPDQIIVGAGSVRCRPLTRMSISRPLPAHRRAHVTFGAAEFHADGERGFGFYEYGRVID